MKDVQVYLSGGMSGLTFEEQTKWRNQIKNAIRFGDYDLGCNVKFFDPVLYYNFEEKHHKTEREVFEFDLHNVKKSDLVVVNFNSPKSIGTAMELMLAKENNIPVIGLKNKDGEELHPWLVECVTRMCDDMRELVDHIVEYYLK